MSGTSHSTALFHLEATPAACPTIAHASLGPPLLVSTPLGVALLLHPITTIVFEQAKACSQEPSLTLANPAATTLHEGDPFRLTLMTLAKALYTHACVTPARALPHVRGGAAHGSDSRRAEVDHQHPACTCPRRRPWSHEVPSGGKGKTHVDRPSPPVPVPARASHALHLPVLKRLATSSHGPEDEAANMYPTSTSCIGHTPGILRASACPLTRARPRRPCPPPLPRTHPGRLFPGAPTPPTLASACAPPPPAPPSTSPPPSLPQSTSAVCDQGQPTHVIPPVPARSVSVSAGVLGMVRFAPRCTGSFSLVIAALTQP
ncbi:hypothetical protein JB92DRAFT_3121181 [Gautieria morchelliformis]|nr:hypothetical protein JB92DRAFT_3121181 [Gautieria morchelliformis]